MYTLRRFAGVCFGWLELLPGKLAQVHEAIAKASCSSPAMMQLIASCWQSSAMAAESWFIGENDGIMRCLEKRSQVGRMIW